MAALCWGKLGIAHLPLDSPRSTLFLTTGKRPYNPCHQLETPVSNGFGPAASLMHPCDEPGEPVAYSGCHPIWRGQNDDGGLDPVSPPNSPLARHRLGPRPAANHLTPADRVHGLWRVARGGWPVARGSWRVAVAIKMMIDKDNKKRGNSPAWILPCPTLLGRC